MISRKVDHVHPEQMEEYFGKFGEIKTCKIICKHDSQVSRGFGFVIYSSREAAEKVIQYRDEHYINGKWVDCKSAILRQEMQPTVAFVYNKNSPKKKKKNGSGKDNSHGNSKKSDMEKNSKSYNNSGSGPTSSVTKVYNYSHEEPYIPPEEHYGYSGSGSYKNEQPYLPNDHHYYDHHQYKHMHSYDSYRYDKQVDHYAYSRYPYESSTSSQVHSYHQHSPVRVSGPGQKKKFGVIQNQHMIPRDHQNEDSHKSMGQLKGGYNSVSPPPRLPPVTHHLSTKEIPPSKPSQLMLPIHNDDEPSQARNSGQYFQGRNNFIPLIEEEDHDGYEDPYSLNDPERQHQMGGQPFPNIGQMQKGDSPSNYKPFGTHFGPKILNRYGGHADFLTPQAKNVMSHQYGNLPGDASAKSSPFKKSGQPARKTQPELLLGFSSLAEQVVKNKAPHLTETDQDLN